jgi:phage shock protein PspC (stress-responsive transcriptional regulator)
MVPVKERTDTRGRLRGLGIYLDADPTVIRLAWVVLTCLSFGIGVVAYIVAWIIVPEEGNPPGETGINL